MQLNCNLGSHPLLVHTWRCVPTLYHPCSPALGTPRWPVWCPLHHRRRSPRCCCAAPPRDLRSVLADSCPPNAPWRLAREPPCAGRKWCSLEARRARDRRRVTAAAGRGSSCRGCGSSWLRGSGLQVKVETVEIVLFKLGCWCSSLFLFI